MYTPMRGSLQNTESTFSLDYENDNITQIEIWSDEKWIYGIRFMTNKGHVSNNGKIFGGNSGIYRMITLTGRLVGSFGQIETGYFTSIGFIENIVDHNGISRSKNCIPPWHYYDGKCYRRVHESQTYNASEKTCNDLRGKLVNINSEAELDIVNNIIDINQVYYVNLT